MLLRLHPSLTPAQRESVHSLAKDLGYRARFLGGSDRWLELEGSTAPSTAHASRTFQASRSSMPATANT